MVETTTTKKEQQHD